MPRDPSNGSQTGVGDKRGPVRHGPAHPAESERRRENEEAARAAIASGTGRGRLESIGKRVCKNPFADRGGGGLAIVN